MTRAIFSVFGVCIAACAFSLYASTSDDWFSAASSGDTASIHKLIDAGTGLNDKGLMGMSPLMIASFFGKADAAAMLLKAHATINLKSGSGLTALMLASQKGHPEIVTVLLEAGADKNIKSASGSTALMFATEKGCDSVIVLLKNDGAHNMNISTSSPKAITIQETTTKTDTATVPHSPETEAVHASSASSIQIAETVPTIPAVKQSFNTDTLMQERLQGVSQPNSINSQGYSRTSAQEFQDIDSSARQDHTIKTETHQGSFSGSRNVVIGDTIVKKGKYYYYRNVKLATPADFNNALFASPEATQMYNSARSIWVASQIIGGIGGGCLGWNLGCSIGGAQKATPAFWAIGIIGMAAGLSIELTANNKIGIAVSTFNAQKKVQKNGIQWKLKYTGNGLAYVMNF